MRSFRSNLLAAAVCLACWPTLAQAHFIASDHDIKVVSHIVPNDDPIIGKPATFFFEISDKQRRFEAAICDCRIRIMREGAELYAGTLFQNHQNVLGSPAFTFTFPERAVYHVVVAGTPKHPDTFPSFVADFAVRVDQTEESAVIESGHGLISHSVHDLLSLIIVGAAIAYLLAKDYSEAHE